MAKPDGAVHPAVEAGMDTRHVIGQHLTPGKSSTLGEARMSAWIATTLVLVITAVAAAATVEAGSCGPKNSYRCADNGQSIDLSSVPDITKKIVGDESVTQSRKKPVIEPAAASPYTGPIVGVTSGKRAPTVGYSWSLE
jgi:hypothetical protein